MVQKILRIFILAGTVAFIGMAIHEQLLTFFPDNAFWPQMIIGWFIVWVVAFELPTVVPSLSNERRSWELKAELSFGGLFIVVLLTAVLYLVAPFLRPILYWLKFKIA